MEVYRIPNIDYATGQISHQDIKYSEFSDDELAQITLKCGDILIVRSNGSVSLVGRAALIREIDIKGTFAGYLMRLRLKDKSSLVPAFLLYFLQSHEARIYIENKAKSTSGVHNINSTENFWFDGSYISSRRTAVYCICFGIPFIRLRQHRKKL